jgi:hypothetical protein
VTDIVVRRGDETIAVTLGGAQGPLGITFDVPPTPGQFLAKAPGSDNRRYVSMAGATPANAVPLTALAAGNGASLVGSAVPVADAPVRGLLDRVNALAVDLDDFRYASDTDYSGASDRACRYCKVTGVTLRLRPKRYAGARIEVHGTFNVEGNGARVDYLGVGTTIVGGSGQGFAAVQTPWAYDVSGYTVQMYAFTGATKGAASLTFATTPAFKAGDIIFLSGEPAGNSSSGANGDNYIPRYFEFQQVKSVSGNTVTLCSPLKEDYTNAKCRAFWTDGMAVNCQIRDLVITTTNDAYQYVVRSAYGGCITGIRFAGNAAVGASTFTGGGFRCSDWVVDGAYGGVSCARGTEDVIFSNIRWRTKSQDVNAQFIAIFIEESCYNVVVDGMKAVGGCFLVNSLNMSNPDGSAPATKRRIAIGGNSVFDTRMVANGSGTGPFQGGAAIGVDIYVDNTLLAGIPTTPDPNQSPGITGAALCWLSSNASYDTVTFGPGCTFISTGTVEAFKSGNAGGGQFLVSEDATYIGAVVPQSRWTPRGIWADFSGQLASGVTPTAGEYALPAVRRPWRGRDVHAEGLVNAPNLADNTALTQLSTFYRPKTTQLITLQGFGGADGYTAINVITRLETNGLWTVVHRNGATVINLRASWPMDW